MALPNLDLRARPGPQLPFRLPLPATSGPPGIQGLTTLPWSHTIRTSTKSPIGSGILQSESCSKKGGFPLQVQSPLPCHQNDSCDGNDKLNLTEKSLVGFCFSVRTWEQSNSDHWLQAQGFACAQGFASTFASQMGEVGHCTGTHLLISMLFTNH